MNSGTVYSLAYVQHVIRAHRGNFHPLDYLYFQILCELISSLPPERRRT